MRRNGAVNLFQYIKEINMNRYSPSTSIEEPKTQTHTRNNKLY